MRLGLCLSGGGAKGSYQAGVIKALYDKGINKFDVIAGTSIGAINGYYIFTENVENLENMWTNIETNPENDIKIVGNTVDNSYALNGLKQLNNNKKYENDFYVNYIEIENSKIEEKVINLSNLSNEEGLESIKYSSLLPFNPKGKLSLGEQFKKDLVEGLYNGYKLDGGLINNTLMDPIIKSNVDKIILISTRHDYVLPEVIEKSPIGKNIIVVRPQTIFTKNDTLRFEKEFCKKMYNEGYKIGQTINIE